MALPHRFDGLLVLFHKTRKSAHRWPLAHHSAWKWLSVGIGVKRWLLLLFAGITLLSLGTAYLLIEFYREQPFPDAAYYVTLQFLPRTLRALLVGGLGVGAVVFALWQLNRTLLSAYAPRETNLVETLYRRMQRQRGLKIVAIGGGTGLSTLLRGLKNYTDHLTAIITVADDGGSSGRLRQELGLLPPGDFRQCIAALADAEPLMSQLLEYRFPAQTGLGGHAFGNLLIAAMAGITGNSERAVLESSRVLAVRGQILPSTLENVTLCAEVRGSGDTQTARVMGESQIAKFGQPVQRVYLEPQSVRAYPGAVKALLEADLIIAGPGSLYTSVLPNLLVGDLCAAVGASAATKLYVCNVATEHGETDGYSVEDFVAALDAHCEGAGFDHVLANDNWSAKLPPHSQVEFVKPRLPVPDSARHHYFFADLADDEFPWRHDPDKLARTILRWYALVREKGAQVQNDTTTGRSNELETRRQGTRELAPR